jgi:hypothetical protein
MEIILRNILTAGLALSVLALAGCVDTGTTYTSSGANRHVTVTNASYATITNFYGSSVGASTWEEDILGSSVIPPGASVDINFDDGTGSCMFDFKAVFADGSTAVEQGINVCTTSGVTVS